MSPFSVQSFAKQQKIVEESLAVVGPDTTSLGGGNWNYLMNTTVSGGCDDLLTIANLINHFFVGLGRWPLHFHYCCLKPFVASYSFCV